MKNDWYSFPYREPICPFVTFKEMKFHKKSTIIEIVTLKIFFEQLRLKIFEKSEIQRGPGGVLCEKAPPLSSGLELWKWDGQRWDQRLKECIGLFLWHKCAWLHHSNLEVSHLCHKKLCVSAAHRVLEMHEVNQERIHC